MELFLAIILPETFSQTLPETLPDTFPHTLPDTFPQTLPEVTLFFRYRVLSIPNGTIPAQRN